ncbi:cyclase family protein [Leucobacter sp. CSA1]|uniref:Cyclase family protein n=1 Tax=Leucobacter chromiisoli TaxID=2796471 RepID=A0A934UV94_9MICO|nr:cyclase family protein [Leucobacter chromiisoli]MBK0419675.1 cyclase family protein [Leucobacter chromiisoli]
MTLVDLSRPVTSGMPVYPGDPEVRIDEALDIETDGVAVASLRMGSHTGTHLDAPSHSIAGGRTVDRIPLDLLCGEARVLRASSVGPGEGIVADHLDAPLPAELPRIVLLGTGWDRAFGTPEALQHPHLAVEFARRLWDRGARVLGVDTFSPDPTDPAATAMPVHEFWLGGDGVIVENLTGLLALPDRVEAALLPLRLAGVDGSPVRAVARIAQEPLWRRNPSHIRTDTNDTNSSNAEFARIRDVVRTSEVWETGSTQHTTKSRGVSHTWASTP